MSMTPERIEEIKRMMEEEYARPNEPFSSGFIISAPQAIADLLAALEESQQQAAEWESIARTVNKKHNEVMEVNQTLRNKLSELEQHDLVKEELVNEKLAEAQQTIARLTAALIAERDDALTWDGIGTVNRINAAIGEGTKEGTDTHE